MAIKETALIDGNLVRIDKREFTRQSDGQHFTFLNALVVGAGTMVNCRVSDEVASKLQPGKRVAGVIQLGSYKDEAQTELIELREPAA